MTTRETTGRTPESTSTAIFTGHARLPQSLGHRFGSTMVSVEIEVDLADARIIDVSCFPISELAERLVKSVLIGRLITTDMDAAAAELQRRYIGAAQRALATAVTSARDTYARWQALGQQTPPDL